MKNGIIKFLYSDSWKHVTNMFMGMVVLFQLTLLIGYKLPLWIQFVIPILVGILWEIFRKKQENIKPDRIDVLWTIIGGYFAILLLNLIHS